MEAALTTLRPHVQTITQNLPDPIAEFGRTLLGPFCYKTLILDFDPLAQPQCVKLAISKVLGVGIIGASAVVKLPQLIKLVQSQSASGVSFTSYLLESSSYLISLAYNVRYGFPFSTYGETSLILVQNVVIAALVLHFQGKSAGAGVWIAGLAAASYVLFNEEAGLVDTNRLTMLQAGAGVLSAASKIPQIWTIYRAGGTGQLSAFAVFNYLVGSLSRIYTTLQEVPDPLILYSFVVGFVLNAILAAQMIFYWNSPTSNVAAPKGKSKSKGKGKGKSPATPKPQALSSGASASGSPKPRTPSTRRRG